MKPVYTGIFFNNRTYDELKHKAYPMLGKYIDHPHITLEFKPQGLLPDDVIGQEVEIEVIAEGNDGYNQGFMVEVPDELKEHYKNPSTPHITTSLDVTEGKAVNTGKLDFKFIKPFKIRGRIGYFTGQGVQFHN